VINYIKMENKAQSYSYRFVIIFLLSLVVLFLIYLFYNQVTSGYTSIPESAECKSSILFATTFDNWDPSAIKCSTNYVTFKKNEPEKIKKRIAEGASSCWNKFGEEKLLLFEHDPGISDRFSDDIVEYCNVCEVYEFENIDTIDGFGKYLTNNNVSKKYDKNGRAYISYLSGTLVNDGEQLQEINREVRDVEIDTSKSYVSLFVYTKDPSYFKKTYLFKQALSSNFAGTIFYGSLAFMFGKEVGGQWNSYMLIVPYEKEELERVCVNLQE